ncbi:DNA-directed RNA polymerase subunit delta [Lactobacillus sp. S2-2]|uniref:DNA-directed RNA polymerase subunit delta n=1 Tax=Lactobacillus sp. S2-2 TaxID=2692917 RepID=UPI001F017E6D|nr:DNA-directed RNA polymerase subunit delta [Lactobacillus sp. S2-2]MCF6515862.1 DNA-directed RNA polymerase subunit delta [Lactobacillus sp. S2-2]
MKLNQFDGQDKKELSMIEVAHAILSDKGESMSFVDIANEIQKYLGDSNREIRDRLPQFYTDLNVDGSFISLGNNVWGLRTWYPYDSIDEATISTEDEDEPRLKKRQKVNAFLADASDDDVIDYENDDPEDQEGSFDVDEEDYHKDLDDDEENDDAEDTEIDDGVEGDLSEIDEDEVESENDDLSDDEEK